jgi:hypothetical protein
MDHARDVERRTITHSTLGNGTGPGVTGDETVVEASDTYEEMSRIRERSR